MGEVYNIQPLNNTHSTLSLNNVTTPNLFYKEEIRNGVPHEDEGYKLEMTELYHEWLRNHGREAEITPPRILQPPEEDPSCWAQPGEEWPNMDLLQLEIMDKEDLIEQQLARWEEEHLHHAWSTNGSSTS